VSGVWAWLTDPAHWTGDNGIPTRLVQHLVISGWAMLIALVVAVPLAVWLGHVGRGGAILVGIGNTGRAIPTYALIVTFALTDQIGVDALAVILALAVFAMPPLLVNTYVAMRGVDVDVKDAATGMGLTGGQLLRKVELPLSFPLLFAGVRTATVQVVATATFAGLVGAGTLGAYVYEGFSIQNYDELYSGVILVALLCVVLERLLAFVQRLVSRRYGQIPPRRRRRDRRGRSPAQPGGEAAGPTPDDELVTIPSP
jgi:osmoprotectant transport system permease protein